MWILYAEFLVRGLDLTKARKVYGMAIGKCPRPKLFKAYAELELQLGEVDRCRTIFEKFVSSYASNSAAWVEYALFEASLQENERARAIFDIAVNTESMDQPEAIWKAYIDFEEPPQARALYEQLLKRTKHVKVWVSYARFESEVEMSRGVFERAN